MKKFRYTNDIEDWLAPMDYKAFWFVIEPYGLLLQPRDHCDQQIADGLVDEETVLHVLKHMARTELTQRMGIVRRPITPWLKLVE